MTRRPASVRLPLIATGLILMGLTLALTHFDPKFTITLTNPPGPTAAVIEMPMSFMLEGSYDYNSIYSEPTAIGYTLTELDGDEKAARLGWMFSMSPPFNPATRRFSMPIVPPLEMTGKLLSLDIMVSTPSKIFQFLGPNPARPDGKFLIRVK
jgi:hypothetical protein